MIYRVSQKSYWSPKILTKSEYRPNFPMDKTWKHLISCSLLVENDQNQFLVESASNCYCWLSTCTLHSGFSSILLVTFLWDTLYIYYIHLATHVAINAKCDLIILEILPEMWAKFYLVVVCRLRKVDPHVVEDSHRPLLICIYMGQFLQGGKNGRLMSFFFKK